MRCAVGRLAWTVAWLTACSASYDDAMSLDAAVAADAGRDAPPIADADADAAPPIDPTPVPACVPPTYDTTAFAALCATGDVLPVALGTRGWTAASDGTLIAVAGDDGLHTFELDGAPRAHVPYAAYWLAAFDCGFAATYGGAIHIFDHDLVEHGARGHANAGPLVWMGDRFASVTGYPAGGTDVRITLLDWRGAVLYDEPLRVYAPSSVVWDGLQLLLAGISGPPQEMLAGVDHDGNLAWSASGDIGDGAGGHLLPTRDGFLEQTWRELTPRSPAGAALGPSVNLATEIGLSFADPFAIASNATEVRAVLRQTASDGSASLVTMTFDGAAHTVGAPRVVPNAAPAIRAGLTLLWAGYSFVALFEPADAPGTTSMIRICP